MPKRRHGVWRCSDVHGENAIDVVEVEVVWGNPAKPQIRATVAQAPNKMVNRQRGFQCVAVAFFYAVMRAPVERWDSGRTHGIWMAAIGMRVYLRANFREING